MLQTTSPGLAVNGMSLLFLIEEMGSFSSEKNAVQDLNLDLEGQDIADLRFIRSVESDGHVVGSVSSINLKYLLTKTLLITKVSHDHGKHYRVRQRLQFWFRNVFISTCVKVVCVVSICRSGSK